MKRYLLHGILSGLLAAVACIAWLKFYEYASHVDFSPVIGIMPLIAIPVIAMIIASLFYGFMYKQWSTRGEWIFNFLLTGITLASLIGPFKTHLETDDEMIQIFIYGLVLPMHFFPAIAWYTLKPMLNHQSK
jgi:hypothetical protein